MDIHQQAASIADELEVELKRLGRWADNPLPNHAFENMGAFGSNTMSFEAWVQFVLIPRLQEIVSTKADFPTESHLAPYAIRYFDGDPNADPFREILYNLDQLINNNNESPAFLTEQFFANPMSPSVSMGDTTIPIVLYEVAEVLPQFALTDLESQLQTFDTFLSILSPTVRPTISAILKKAADHTTQPDCKKRIEQAALDVAEGKRAAPPYNHEDAMKKYKEEHDSNFPTQEF